MMPVSPQVLHAESPSGTGTQSATINFDGEWEIIAISLKNNNNVDGLFEKSEIFYYSQRDGGGKPIQLAAGYTGGDVIPLNVVHTFILVGSCSIVAFINHITATTHAIDILARKIS